MNLNLFASPCTGSRRKPASDVNLIPKTTVAEALVQEPQRLSGASGL